MSLRDLHVLPKVRDSWSYLYVEHCRVDQEDEAVAVHGTNGKAGTSITHAAVHTLADCGCLVGWTVSALVRDKLWEKACAGVKGGAATLIHTADNEQGFAVRLWGGVPSRAVVDFEGLWLVHIQRDQ